MTVDRRVRQVGQSANAQTRANRRHLRPQPVPSRCTVEDPPARGVLLRVRQTRRARGRGLKVEFVTPNV